MGKFICVGLNYSDHAAETGNPIPKEPILFMKPTSALVGCNDPIVLPQGTVEIGADGMVKVNNHAVQRLRLERVAPGTQLQHEGGTQFVPDASRQAIPPAERSVKQGFLEESNVNTMSAMTDMLAVLHRYGAAQKTLSTIDAVRGIAVNDLAKPV